MKIDIYERREGKEPGLYIAGDFNGALPASVNVHWAQGEVKEVPLSEGTQLLVTDLRCRILSAIRAAIG